MRYAALIVTQAVALAIFLVGNACAADVKVIASTAIKTVLEELHPQFEKATEHKLAITYGASARMQTDIEKGAAFDLAILSTAATDALIKQGKLLSATRVVVARSGAGVAVRKGAPRPDVSTTDGFKRALLNARSLGYSEAGATGQFLMAMFQKLGITDEMKPKLKLASLGEPSLKALADGAVEMVLPQISEVILYPGVDLVGPLPPDVQVYTVLPAAVSSTAKAPEAANALIKFLAAPASVAVMKAKGLEPG